MSAHICNNEYFITIAAHALASGPSISGSCFVSREETQLLATELLRENERSCGYRYRDDTFITDELVEVSELQLSTALRVQPFKVVDMINSYRYQSCEHSEWAASPARLSCEKAMNHAVDRMRPI